MKAARPIIICALSAIAFTASAQEIRFSGGYNGSNVQEANGKGWVGQGGYQLGADVLLGNRFFLRTGAHFLVRNLKYSFVPNNENGVPDPDQVPEQEYRFTTQSLKVPFHFGIHVLDPEDEPLANAYALVGPSAVFGLSHRVSQNEAQIETTGVQGYVGLGAGLSLSFLFIEGGYDIGLTRYAKTDFTEPKLNVYYIVGGVRLNLAK